MGAERFGGNSAFQWPVWRGINQFWLNSIGEVDRRWKISIFMDLEASPDLTLLLRALGNSKSTLQMVRIETRASSSLEALAAS